MEWLVKVDDSVIKEDVVAETIEPQVRFFKSPPNWHHKSHIKVPFVRSRYGHSVSLNVPV